MSFLSNGGKFKLYTVLNALIFPTPTQPTISFERQIQITITAFLIYIYKTECLFVCIFCMQIYSFTPILMKFCTLDLQNKKKITVYFNFTKTNPYYHFQPC
jgi:hypothetical protein